MQFPQNNVYQPTTSHPSYQHSYSFMPPTLNPANAAYQTTTAQQNQFSNSQNLEGAHLYSSRPGVSSSNQNFTENPSLHVSKNKLFQHEQLILFIVIKVSVITWLIKYIFKSIFKNYLGILQTATHRVYGLCQRFSNWGVATLFRVAKYFLRVAKTTRILIVTKIHCSM
jgi:hypothetical protein